MDNYNPNANDEIISVATEKYDAILKQEKEAMEKNKEDELELNFEQNKEGEYNELFKEKPDTIDF